MVQQPNPSDRPKPAFTLIELLVVVAIIAVLISILLPSLSQARKQARAVVCLAHIRGTLQAEASYRLPNNDYIPGPNTTGLSLHRDGAYQFGSDTPTQDWDWLSPILGQAFELPGDRLEKYQEICMTKMRCPENKERYGTQFTGPKLPMFEKYGEHPYILSYITPAYFHLIPNPGGSSSNPPFEYAPTSSSVSLPNSYRPQAQRVGKLLSEKVLLFEGGRYYDGPENGFDYTTLTNTTGITGNPQGNFSSIGPAFSNGGGEIAYYDKDAGGGLRPTDLFLKVGLRHNKRMQVGFFDGHAAPLSAEEAADVSYYVPGGSEIPSASQARRLWINILSVARNSNYLYLPKTPIR